MAFSLTRWFLESKTFCFCLPLRFGVILFSFLTWLVAAVLSFLLWFELASKHDSPLSSKVRISVIAAGVVETILFLASLLGFVGAIIRKESFVKLYSYFLYIHLIINVAVGSYFLWMITHTATPDEGLLCTEIFQNDGAQSTCNKLFSVGKNIFIGIIICIWLIELYVALVVTRYHYRIRADERNVRASREYFGMVKHSRYESVSSDVTVGLLNGQDQRYLDPYQDSTSRFGTLSDTNRKRVGDALEKLVDLSSAHNDLTRSIHAHSTGHIPFLKELDSGLEVLANKYHFGNYVAIRGTNEKLFESMPIYERLGMHLLFYGHVQILILKTKAVETILREQSIKEGKHFDSRESAKSIASFVKTYSIQLDELLEPDITKYKTFNQFFFRKLKNNTRPVQNAGDPLGICCAADSRLTVYQTIDFAKKFWIKGKQFNIPNLLNVPEDSDIALTFREASIAIFRLAPGDYHRFHSPIDGEVGEIVNIAGQYYTVNPQAVNEPGFDVFTANTRSVLYMKHVRTSLPVVVVAIGALLVGSIEWTNGAQRGSTVRRGDELGYFAYGGSTVVVVFPSDIQLDIDLVKNSEIPIETLVKVGFSLGKTPGVY